MECYECGTDWGVESWRIGPSKMAVPLCTPCRKKCSHVFAFYDQKMSSNQDEKPSDFVSAPAVIFMTIWGVFIVGTGAMLVWKNM